MTVPAGQLPRLLRGVGERPMHELDEHLAVHGPLGHERLAPEQIISSVQEAGLRGHGGAAFPTAIKLRSVANRRGSKVLLVNATEGEPASKKDRALLREVPHLVLDGAAVAARAVGAKQAILAVSEADTRGRHALAAALHERRERGLSRSEPDWELVSTPERYLIGQETALVNFINGGPGVPAFGTRPFQRGVRGRPTLVQNAETLAHIALIARHGPRWFRGLGTAAHPGSTLISVAGAVSAPGVYEIAHGMELTELLRWVRRRWAGRGAHRRVLRHLAAGQRDRVGTAVRRGTGRARRGAWGRRDRRSAPRRVPGGRDRARGRVVLRSERGTVRPVRQRTGGDRLYRRSGVRRSGQPRRSGHPAALVNRVARPRRLSAPRWRVSLLGLGTGDIHGRVRRSRPARTLRALRLPPVLPVPLTAPLAVAA